LNEDYYKRVGKNESERKKKVRGRSRETNQLDK
jgi:hypothetical protein